MCVRWLKLRPVLVKFCDEGRDDYSWQLSKPEWRALEQTVAVLQSFADITDDLQADTVRPPHHAHVFT
jgi:hypothetical protein